MVTTLDAHDRPGPGADAQPLGLRERKKQHTRDAIVNAAFDLFARKGFDATTVEEIADAVLVSPRTVFRYFATKDDVALDALDQRFTATLEAFTRRPAEEPVITALRRAATEVLRAYEAGQFLPTERYRLLDELLRTSPGLAARSLEQSYRRLDDVAEKIADRMGVDVNADPRPRLVSSVLLSVIAAAKDTWRTAEPDTPASELVDRTFALLEESINYPSAHAAAEK